jgi:hypothetical protein
MIMAHHCTPQYPGSTALTWQEDCHPSTASSTLFRISSLRPQPMSPLRERSCVRGIRPQRANRCKSNQKVACSATCSGGQPSP